MFKSSEIVGSVLYCTVLHYTVPALYCTILDCTILCSTILYYTVQNELYSTVQFSETVPRTSGESRTALSLRRRQDRRDNRSCRSSRISWSLLLFICKDKERNHSSWITEDTQKIRCFLGVCTPPPLPFIFPGLAIPPRAPPPFPTLLYMTSIPVASCISPLNVLDGLKYSFYISRRKRQPPPLPVDLCQTRFCYPDF